MVKSTFFSLTIRLIASGVIYVPSGLPWLRMQRCSTHLSEQFIKKKKSDISVKPHPPKRHKAILFWKVRRKAVSFIILLMRVTNVLTAQRPLVIGGKFCFWREVSLYKASSYLKKHWWKRSAGWKSHVSSTVVAFVTGESSPMCDGVIALETWRGSQYRCVMIHRLQHNSEVLEFVTPAKLLSIMTFWI